MAFVSKFCFFCSVRLGAIIISAFTLVQASALLGLCISALGSLESVGQSFKLWLDTLGLKDTFVEDATGDTKTVVIIGCIFFSALISCCVFLIYGAYQLKTLLLYPFVLFYLLYIFQLFVALLSFVFYVKAEGRGLGDLILYSNLGGFGLLFYLYTWACVVSLIQIINELKRRLENKLRVVEKTKLTNKMRISNKNTFHNAHFN